MEHEIQADEFDSTEIAPNETLTLSSCGRSNSPTGTEGAIQLAEEQTTVCTLYWDCPWGSESNNFDVRDRNNRYVVSPSEWSRNGPLGTAEVDIYKKG